MKFNHKIFFDGFKNLFDPTLEQSQVDGIEFLLGKFESDPHWGDTHHIAYALATIYHETAGSMQPVEEGYYLGSTKRVKEFQKTLRYYPHYGRGYVQLTWPSNYAKASRELGIDLNKHPELALEPDNAFQIMTLGMFEGWFTGKKLTDYINPNETDYVNARKIINRLDKAGLIAGYARHFEKLLSLSAAGSSPTPSSPSDTLPTVADARADSQDNTKENPSPTTSVKAEITPEGGVKVESTEGTPQPKERIAVVQSKPQTWFSRVSAKITGAVTGNALFQWIWVQMEKIQGLSVPDAVWIIVSLTLGIGSLLWIIHEIIETWRLNKYQENIDNLLVKENSTPDNLVQLIPADEAELYRMRGFKIITRGEKA